MATDKKREMMEKMWKYRKNLAVQLMRFVVLGLHFNKLVKKVH
ncbi:hypothetical protein [Persephonella sp.]|nr:hypothetical protein [Persephonella sp.]